MNQEFLSQIVSSIREIETNYRNYQGLILSEDDLKCLLFNKIYELIPEKIIETNDPGIYASPLHTEIPFYDEHKNLRLRPDITILDLRGMSLKHGLSIISKSGKSAYGKFPSKGFEFSGPTIVIEIKFFKSKAGIRQANIECIRRDIEKIYSLARRLNRPEDDNNILGLIVVFNKTNKVAKGFDRLLKDYEKDDIITVVYGTSNFVY